MKTHQANQYGQPVNANGEVLRLSRPSLYNGEVVIEFESEDEFNSYLSAMHVTWSANYYATQINDAHNALFRELFTQRNYLSIGEISLWVDDAEFGAEARNMRTWWNTTCKIVADYLETVTEETALPVADFIANLPQIAEV